jgi:hypothetical protein
VTAPKEIWVGKMNGDNEHDWSLATVKSDSLCDTKYLSSTHARSPEHLKTLSDSEIEAAGYVRKNPQSRVPFDAYIDQLDDNK